jgi:hypothetical protein
MMYTKFKQKPILIDNTRKLNQALTTKGKSQEIPLPFWRSAIVVGPAREGIQKKPSVRSPLILDTEINLEKKDK